MDEINSDKKTDENNKDGKRSIETEYFDSEDIEKNKTMAGLAYILFFLPLVTCKDSRFGRFHANQGLLLLILSIAGYVAISIITSLLITFTWRFLGIISLLNSIYGLCIFALVVYGAVNALNGKSKELPVIGKFRILH